MARLINEAYAAIAHAPLRYYTSTSSGEAKEKNGQQPNSGTGERSKKATDKIPKTDRLEFFVRFVCGGLFGVFIILDLFVSSVADFSQPSGVLALGAASIILGCGFASARYGDKFWHTIFRRWWLWS
jgi:hypothetical protein